MAKSLTQLTAAQFVLIQEVETNRQGIAANIDERLVKLGTLKAQADTEKVIIAAKKAANPDMVSWEVVDEAAEDLCELVDGLLEVVQAAHDGLANFDGDE